MECMFKPKYFSVTQFIGGGELYSLIQEYGCLSEDVVRIYVAEIALALGKYLCIFIFRI